MQQLLFILSWLDGIGMFIDLYPFKNTDLALVFFSIPHKDQVSQSFEYI